MSRKPKSPRVPVGGVIGVLTTLCMTALLVLGERAMALGVPPLACVGYLLWRRLESGREPQRPLTADLEGRSAKQEWSDRSARRIRIHNGSPARTLRSVRVELVEFTPRGADFLPAELQRMDGGEQPFDLNPGTDAYVELVALAAGSDELVLGFDMARVEPGAKNLVPAPCLALVVRVSADGVPAEQYLFSASVDRQRRLQLVDTTAPAPLLSRVPQQAGVASPREKAPAVSAILWVANRSAWGRWQKAAHRTANQRARDPEGFTAENLMHLATSVLSEAARSGKVGLWGVPAGKAALERIDTAVLQTRARLRLARDELQTWTVTLAAHDSLAVDMDEVERLWPEYDVLTDDRTRGLNREWKKRSSYRVRGT